MWARSWHPGSRVGKKHSCKKRKMNSTALGKTLSRGRELLKRIPGSHLMKGYGRCRVAGSLAPNHSKCFLHNVILEPRRRKHREASQREAHDADSPAGEQATAKGVPVRVSGVGQEQGDREWPAWGRWIWRFPPHIEGWSQTIWVQVPAPPPTG